MISKAIKLLFFAGLPFLAALSACKHDPILENIPAMSFKQDVQPVLIANCTMSGCHGSQQPEEFALLTYADVMEKIEAGKPTKSEIYKAITTSGEDAMPPAPNQPLSSGQITRIYYWILQGAPNN